MKSLLATHWEKLLLGFAVLLVALSAVWNLLLAKEPAAAGQGLASIQALNGIIEKAPPIELPVPKILEEVRRLLGPEGAAGTFSPPKDLMNYGGGTSTASYPMMEGTTRRIPLSEPATGWELLKNPGCVSVSKVSGEEALQEFKALLVEAKQPGTVTISLKFYAKSAGSVIVTVRPKPKIEIWPPVLQGAQVSPNNPGEVTLTWTDNPRTSFQMTLGYVIERRVLPDGVFQPILGDGRMLPAGTTSYVDVAEPVRQYEYRVIAVGDPAVTHVMPQP